MKSTSTGMRVSVSTPARFPVIFATTSATRRQCSGVRPACVVPSGTITSHARASEPRRRPRRNLGRADPEDPRPKFWAILAGGRRMDAGRSSRLGLSQRTGSQRLRDSSTTPRRLNSRYPQPSLCIDQNVDAALEFIGRTNCCHFHFIDRDLARAAAREERRNKPLTKGDLEDAVTKINLTIFAWFTALFFLFLVVSTGVEENQQAGRILPPDTRRTP